ncbi:SH3 domain-containing protein [Vannielia litorea]|uniref:SH3 domain-containing protein n=1 Tax=Vannielia litorea TaxID=1217970 RepID=UPI001BD06E65|nr:SH3 domain-containing protein [Vannielia litorea]
MKAFLTGAVAALSLTCVAPAIAAEATAMTDLNLRAGPGMDYAVVGTLAARQTAEVEGCLANSPWCRVRAGDETGWAVSRHLSGSAEVMRPVAAATITLRPDEETTPAELDAAVVNGRLVEAPAEVAPLIEIPEDAVAVYMTERAGPDTPADGAAVELGRPDAGVTVHTVPGAKVTYLTIDGETRILKPDTKTTVYINR